MIQLVDLDPCSLVVVNLVVVHIPFPLVVITYQVVKTLSSYPLEAAASYLVEDLTEVDHLAYHPLVVGRLAYLPLVVAIA